MLRISARKVVFIGEDYLAEQNINVCLPQRFYFGDILKTQV